MSALCKLTAVQSPRIATISDAVAVRGSSEGAEIGTAYSPVCCRIRLRERVPKVLKAFTRERSVGARCGVLPFREVFNSREHEASFPKILGAHSELAGACQQEGVVQRG